MTVKARLIPLGKDEKEGEGFDVQFNPTSLTIQYRSNTGQKEKGSVLPAQYLGLRSATMSVDLIFDTADIGADVRQLTGRVLAFLDPSKAKKAKKGAKAGPPRMKFQWGAFWITGVVNDASEELDLWSPTGTPLRAKIHLNIEGQDPLLRKAMTSPSDGTLPGGGGSQNLNNPAAPGLPEEEPGQQTAPRDRSAAALAGESAAAFAARSGLDPRAWRALGLRGVNPMALPAGAQIDFASDTRVPPAPGTSFKQGLPISGSLSSGSSDPNLGGGSQPRPGGSASAEALRAQEGVAAAALALRDFDLVPTPVQPISPAPVVGGAGAATATARPSASSIGDQSTTARVSKVDPRSASYGFGVPLRPRWDVDPSDRTPVVLREKRAAPVVCALHPKEC